MKRLLASPGFVTLIGGVIVAVLAVAGYVVAFRPMDKTIGYCAILPDAVGLYPGNHVTMLGIPVGTVTALEPEGDAVRVEFDVDADHPLTGQVTATTVADTLVADRNLAVLGEPGAPTWNRSACVTTTFTPKSITETLSAFSALADQLGGSGDPAEQNRIHDSVAAFQRATSGTGPKMNALIKDLGTALRAPDAAIGHIGALLDALGELSTSISINWPDIKTTLLNAGDGIAFVNEIWQQVIQIVDSLLVDFPMFNDIARKYGREILGGIDDLVPYLRLLGANVGTLKQVIDMIPALVGAFQRAIDPETGKVRITYAAPKVALPQADADQICAAVNIVTPGRCKAAENGLAQVDLAALVLGSVGAR
ncbi:MlaD family protein [Nocardia sp. GCM10030253]|uniref:MlaD family protein n=1 Tax=Nocardia sp. GCM10030253 TaxID=3273404 RepID=UPI00362AD877